VEVILHNYSDDNVLRGMVIENLTQRSDELFEVTENLAVVRMFLKDNCSSAEQLLRKKDSLGRTQSREEEAGSIRNIYDWLNKNGEVMSIGKISEYLKVHDNLDRDLLEQTQNCLDKSRNKENKISIEEAKSLARLDKKDQRKIREILDETGLDYKTKSKLVTQYLQSSDEIQEKVIDGDLNIEELEIQREVEKNKKQYDEATKSKDDKIKIIRTSEILPNVREEISKTTRELDRFFNKVRIVKFAKLSWGSNREKKDFRQFIDIALRKAENWVEELNRIQEEIEYEN